jgi:hypothetical protein
VVLKVGVRDPGHRDQLGDRPAPKGLGDVNEVPWIGPFEEADGRPAERWAWTDLDWMASSPVDGNLV